MFNSVTRSNAPGTDDAPETLVVEPLSLFTLDPLKFITKTVLLLSLVSLFTDMASEMLYPVMPLYLKSIGFSVLMIGILEGIAEAAAGLSKGYFGQWSDLSGKRVPFVRLGYAFSAAAKPLLAVFSWPLWVVGARTLDRLGKGIRTGARDAMLSDEATPETKGTIFGFHRSMDTLGAVIGPVLGLIYLYYYPGNYKTLFIAAIIPGLLAIVSTVPLRDKLPRQSYSRPSFFGFFAYWKTSPREYKRLVIGLLIFSAVNSSDMFLLLQVRQAGMSDADVIGFYIFYNLVYAVFAFPAGIVADKIGLKTTFLIGLGFFVLTYSGMALIENPFGAPNPYLIVLLFFLYGLYAATTEGIAKAWISNLTDKADVATGIGTFAGLQSLCLMAASSLTGYLWLTFGAPTAFLTSAAITFLSVLFLLGSKNVRTEAHTPE